MFPLCVTSAASFATKRMWRQHQKSRTVKILAQVEIREPISRTQQIHNCIVNPRSGPVRLGFRKFSGLGQVSGRAYKSPDETGGPGCSIFGRAHRVDANTRDTQRADTRATRRHRPTPQTKPRGNRRLRRATLLSKLHPADRLFFARRIASLSSPLVSTPRPPRRPLFLSWLSCARIVHVRARRGMQMKIRNFHAGDRSPGLVTRGCSSSRPAGIILRLYIQNSDQDSTLFVLE